MKKYLFLIFAGSLVFRLFFALSTSHFSDESSYFVLRQAEYIQEHGVPMFDDPLSYGGRTYIFLPVYHYIVGIFSIFLPTWAAAKLVTNLSACLIVFPVFLIVKQLTKNDKTAILSSFVVSFIPAYIFATLNSASTISMTVPATAYLMYLFLTIPVTKKATPFILIFAIYLMTSSDFFLFVAAACLYLVISWTEGLMIGRAEIELLLFSLFSGILVLVLVFRDALLIHGYQLIYSNIPQPLLGNYFSDFSLIQAAIGVGIIPLLAAAVSFFVFFSKVKKKSVYLPMGFCIVILGLLSARLIPVLNGLSYLGVMCAILFGEIFEYVHAYFSRTRFSSHSLVLFLAIFAVFFVSSLVPSYYAGKQAIDATPSADILDAMEFLRTETNETIVVAASPENGNMLAYLAQRKNIIDTNFLFAHDAEKRYADLAQIFSSAIVSKPIELMSQYGSDYILLDQSARVLYNITRLSYIDDCFPQVFISGNVTIFERKCSLQ